MKINKKIILTSLLAIILLWIGNIVFYFSGSIEGPIFNKVYSDGYFYRGLYYVLDENDKDIIVSLTFPELNNLEMQISNNDFDIFTGSKTERDSDGCIRYNIYPIDLWLERCSNGMQLSNNDDFTITKVKYRTLSGKEGECDIGRISYKNPTKDIPYKLYEVIGNSFTSNSKGQQNEGITTVKAKDDITIKGFKDSVPEEVFEYYEIKVKDIVINKTSEDINIKSGECFEVRTTLKKEIPHFIFYGDTFPLRVVDPEGIEQIIDIVLPKIYENNNYGDIKALLNNR